MHRPMIGAQHTQGDTRDLQMTLVTVLVDLDCIAVDAPSKVVCSPSAGLKTDGRKSSEE